MKTTTTLFLFFLPFLVYSQVKTVKLSEKKIGPLTCEYSRDINLEEKDTSTFIIIFFQNEKYRQITDIHTIAFRAQDTLSISEFVTDLKTALPEVGTKSEVSWDKSKYSLNLYNFSPELYLRSRKQGFSTLNKKQVEDLIAWLNGIGY